MHDNIWLICSKCKEGIKLYHYRPTSDSPGYIPLTWFRVDLEEFINKHLDECLNMYMVPDLDKDCGFILGTDQTKE